MSWDELCKMTIEDRVWMIKRLKQQFEEEKDAQDKADGSRTPGAPHPTLGNMS